MKRKILALIFAFTFLFLVGCGGTASTPPEDVDVVFDATTVSRITSAALEEMLGAPASTDTWNNETSKGTFAITIYSYTLDNIDYEFLIADDAVVRMNVTPAEGISYSNDNKSDCLAMFGITPADDSKVIADTGSAFRMSPVSDTVGDFWIPIMDSDAKTFELVKITFNMNYFD